MININEVFETNNMIEKENFDVRTITMGISLLDCIDSDLAETNRKIREKTWAGYAAIGVCAVIMLLCVAALASQSYNPFIYFRF